MLNRSVAFFLADSKKDLRSDDKWIFTKNRRVDSHTLEGAAWGSMGKVSLLDVVPTKNETQNEAAAAAGTTIGLSAARSGDPGASHYAQACKPETLNPKL